MSRSKYLAISGGVGGAKLALGLAKVVPPDDLVIVANTGDDFEHLGFYICPDLDTVMYTLAEVSNRELGWGQAGESWNFLDALERLGGETWFRLGDRDLATHAIRTTLLGEGRTLSAVTDHLCAALGIAPRLVPMSDQAIPTEVITRDGRRLAFQHYFVRDRCAPAVTGFEFVGVEAAVPSPGFKEALDAWDLGAIIICPSNPFVSVEPVLRVPGVELAMRASEAPLIAVSPIVGGVALKGPAAKMMKELGMPETALAVAEYYRDRIDAFVIDDRDEQYTEAIEALGMKVLVTDTVMNSLDDRIRLAREILAFAPECR